MAQKITSVETKERDVTPRNSRHCLLADVTVNFSGTLSLRNYNQA